MGPMYYMGCIITRAQCITWARLITWAQCNTWASGITWAQMYYIGLNYYMAPMYYMGPHVIHRPDVLHGPNVLHGPMVPGIPWARCYMGPGIAWGWQICGAQYKHWTRITWVWGSSEAGKYSGRAGFTPSNMVYPLWHM